MTDMTECGKMTKDVEARIEVSEIQYLKLKKIHCKPPSKCKKKALSKINI